MVAGTDRFSLRSSLKVESLTHIDIASLSQSELHALSLCYSSASDIRHFNDEVIIPAIDPSLFNESAGTHRQTYSLPGQSNPQFFSVSGHRRRFPGLLPTPKLPPLPADDPENIENKSIISFLKQYIDDNRKFDQKELLASLPPPLPVEISSNDVEMESGQMVDMVNFGGERKRKRGRKPKVRNAENDGKGLEIVNKNGVVVDLLALASVEDPYGEELRRRTVGLESEQELLGFLTELSGQWGSRRMRRKFVDASDFGDALPVGWKLVLGLKRREGRVWLYCRSYISPSGEHFSSCKEVSSYLQSYYRPSDLHQLVDHRDDNTPAKNRVDSESQARITYKDSDHSHNIISGSSLLSFPKFNEHGNGIGSLAIDNLAEVQIRDLFECHKCDMSFDQKDPYLQHLLSFHQKTTRRFRLGSSVGDGVIIKDGKYECQFCHKVFQERRRYNGHVGVHVRNYMKRVEEESCPMNLEKRIDSPGRIEFPSGISKMDALIEIAQNSILQTSSITCNDEPNGGSPDVLNMNSTPEIPGAESDCEMTHRSQDQEFHQQEGERVTNVEKKKNIIEVSNADDVEMDSCWDTTAALPCNVQIANSSETLGGNDGMGLTADETDNLGIKQERDSKSYPPAKMGNLKVFDVDDNLNLVCTSIFGLPKHDAFDNDKCTSLGIGFERSSGEAANDAVTDTVLKTSEEHAIQCGVSDSSMSLLLRLHDFPIVNAISDKGEDEFCSVDQSHDRIPAFGELKLDEMETLDFNIASGKENLSMSEVPMDLANSSLQFETEEVVLNMAGGHSLVQFETEEVVLNMAGGHSSVQFETEEVVLNLAGRHSSVQFETEEVVLNLAGRHRVTTVCVWCGIEFSREAIDNDIHSDSVGFMCPTCKEKISGQLNVFGNVSSMNSHCL